jgi:hypothetical protein
VADTPDAIGSGARSKRMARCAREDKLKLASTTSATETLDAKKTEQSRFLTRLEREAG